MLVHRAKLVRLVLLVKTAGRGPRALRVLAVSRE